jgi:hypothetical protein
VKDSQHLISFDQNDSFGQAGYDGLVAAYASLSESEGLPAMPDGDEPITRFRYTRDDVTSVPQQVDLTTDYLDGLLRTAGNHAVGVLMTDTYGPGSQYIQGVRDWQYADIDRAGRLTIVFSNVSFVGPNSLASKLVSAGEASGVGGSEPYTHDVYVSQVVPNYDQDSSDAVLEYKRLLAETGAKPNFTSLEGYIAGRVFIAGLLRHSGQFTSEELVNTFEQLPDLSLGLGATSGFSPDNHNYSRSVWGTSITPDGTFTNVYYWREGTPISFFE